MPETLGPNSLGDFNIASIQHQNQYEKSLNNDAIQDILPNIVQMRTAVESVFGKKRIILGGDQSMLPIPKMAAKLVAMRALTLMDDQVVTINLRAEHDLALSELEILSMTMPHPGTNLGTTKVRLLSDKFMSGKPIISGIDFKKSEVFEYLISQLVRYGNVTFEEAYNASLKVLGRNIGERDEIVKQSQRVIADWFACYGIDRQGNRLTKLPEHLAIPDHSSSSKVENGLQQIEMKLPVNLAQAHENWYIWLQKQLGIELQYTLSEGILDRFLLKNGGLEILQKRWKSAMKKLEVSGYQPVSSRLRYDETNATFFNVAREGQRYLSFFETQDDSMVIAVDPLSKQTFRIPVGELINNESEWAISLSAIPRVALYALAGFAGHIKGGGSRYNYDAEAITLAIGLPYLPLWNFTERVEGSWTSPIQYVSVATENTLRSTKLHHAQKAQSISKAVSEGKIYLLDLLLSINPLAARSEVTSWIEANGGSIKKDDRIYLTNLAGRKPNSI